MSMVVVGDALLDRDVHGSARRLSPDAPVPVLDEGEAVTRPGGAGLAATLAAADGRAVKLVTALGAGGAAEELRAELERRRVEVVDLGIEGSTPEKIRFFAGEHQLMRLDRDPRPALVGPATAAARAALGWADAVLVSDYGRGVAAEPSVREALAERPPRAPLVWDPHPKGAAPVAGATIATPNEAEVERFMPSGPSASRGTDVLARAEDLRRAWRVGAVCVTRGARGAVLVAADAAPLALPAPPAVGGDPCGAGDRFASCLASALADGQSLAAAVHQGIAIASAFVAAGGARGALHRPSDAAPAAAVEPFQLARRVRAAGGTVVATGGCFDLLHAGHISTLATARRLGDCLIVCVNSDASVRRLKGPKRPLVAEQDRVSVLTALSCVDGVVVFEEDSPEQVLRRLRPHVWTKGGDYAGVRLPEADVLAEWEGRSVVLPYVYGRSTTRLIEEAATGA